MVVLLRAMRVSNELLANATMVKDIRKITCAFDIVFLPADSGDEATLHLVTTV